MGLTGIHNLWGREGGREGECVSMEKKMGDGCCQSEEGRKRRRRRRKFASSSLSSGLICIKTKPICVKNHFLNEEIGGGGGGTYRLYYTTCTVCMHACIRRWVN